MKDDKDNNALEKQNNLELTREKRMIKLEKFEEHKLRSDLRTNSSKWESYEDEENLWRDLYLVNFDDIAEYLIENDVFDNDYIPS